MRGERATAGTRGFALLSALLALVVGVALAAAGSLFILSETRLAENAGHEAQATGVAEVGAGDALAGWRDGWDTLGLIVIPERVTPGNTGRYWGFVRRLGGDLFLIDVTGASGASRARVGLLVALAPPEFPAAALVSGGDVALSPGAEVEGAVQANARGAGLVGDLDLGRVARVAQLTLPAGRYAIQPADGPVIHIEGDGIITGGSGTGVLLVDGDLRIEGPLTFRGVVIARGVLVVSGSGLAISHLIGSVVTFVRASGDSTLSLTYDKTLIDSSLRTFRTPVLDGSRSWIRLF